MVDPAIVIPHQNWLRIHPLEIQRFALLSQRIYSSIFWILITKEIKKRFWVPKKHNLMRRIVPLLRKQFNSLVDLLFPMVLKYSEYK